MVTTPAPLKRRGTVLWKGNESQWQKLTYLFASLVLALAVVFGWFAWRGLATVSLTESMSYALLVSAGLSLLAAVLALVGAAMRSPSTLWVFVLVAIVTGTMIAAVGILAFTIDETELQADAKSEFATMSDADKAEYNNDSDTFASDAKRHVQLSAALGLVTAIFMMASMYAGASLRSQIVSTAVSELNWRPPDMTKRRTGGAPVRMSTMSKGNGTGRRATARKSKQSSRRKTGKKTKNKNGNSLDWASASAVVPSSATARENSVSDNNRRRGRGKMRSSRHTRTASKNSSGAPQDDIRTLDVAGNVISEPAAKRTVSASDRANIMASALHAPQIVDAADDPMLAPTPSAGGQVKHWSQAQEFAPRERLKPEHSPANANDVVHIPIHNLQQTHANVTKIL
eukprot:TRINITY_DN52591_c0_g1_i1.p1 TRINITY_DN52591_c0_g1~~TRINITY_DN52591_c0_g1_i1.p1  ORF type:complete len:400 (+),score=166.99 TRINITY_DN52591_c0_g1_i1:47-1246(+)